MMLYFIHTRKNAGTSVIDFLGRTGVKFNVVDAPVPNGVSIAIARNPYTRCVSAWKYCSTTRNRSLLDCLADPPKPGDISSSWVKPGHDYRHFTKKQSQFMFSGDQQPSYTLRFENLENDLRDLCLTLDLPFVRLNHYNKGSYHHTLTDEEREAVYQFYKEDFEKLGYDK
jgi:hypothetical protein